MVSFRYLLEVSTSMKVLHLKKCEVGDFSRACPLSTELGESFALTSASFRSGPVAMQHPHRGKG